MGFMTEPDYTADGVPTFDYVRDRIENKFTTAEASTELADEAAPEDKFEEREKAGIDRLEEIRRSMRGE
ncbi:hypothetical protein FKR81_10705 [Lentzea tibetensis]|uniref:Uncharacterized protein n=2 Tax=Lentzea tibetensis TaxID=2591470 RepID=A0A563EWJ9_9PSEU|nr:hypothetical protein FKR81_10705 [Lentzea tibetensis]